MAEGGGVLVDPTSLQLRIGDSVSFFCTELSGGFMQSRVSSTAHSTVNVAPGGGSISHPNTSNFKTCVFTVLAQNKYKANKKFDKALSKAKGVTRESLDRLGGSAHPELHKLKKLADAETEDNDLEQSRLKGKPVLYGQTVQLLHEFSSKFLRVSTTQTSHTENNNMRVELDAADRKHCYFKILPRYKVRSEGDPVRFEDQILLESVKRPGQLLHLSKTPFDEDHVDSYKHEINLSVTPSAFQLQFHRHPLPDSDQHLKAGDLIRLFHKEVEAYLASEGPNVTHLDFNVPLEEVHLRVRPLGTTLKSLEPPTSAINFFQIESEDDLTDGSEVVWEQQVKLRHATNQLYLAVSARGSVYMSTDSTSPDTVFRLYPVIREEAMIRYDVYVRIFHVVTRTWFHASQKEYPRAQYFGMDGDTGMGGLKWDGASLLQIEAAEQEFFDDAYTVSRVPPEIVEDVNFVAGMVPVLEKYVHNRKSGVTLRTKEAADMVSTLKELRKFMYVLGEATKQKQKLLRNFCVIDILVEMLKAPFSEFSPGQANVISIEELGRSKHEYLKKVCKYVYEVLASYLEGNSRKNELYVAKHLPFFQQQIGYGLNAMKMITELVRDNRLVVDRYTNDQIQGVIRSIGQSKNYRFLDFLGVLCECEGIAIQSNQDFVCEQLLVENHKNNSGLVYLTEVDPPGSSFPANTICVNTSGFGDSWVQLESFAKTAMDEDDSTSTPEYLYLQSQLDLLGKMCLNRNDSAIAIITESLKYLTWKETFLCVQSHNLPKSLRARYCDIMINMFVDVGYNRNFLEEIQLSFIWNDLAAEPNRDAAEDRTTAVTGAKFEQFPELADWIAGFMAQQDEIIASDIGGNKLLKRVLTLIKYLVSFGYYASQTDILKLIPPLLGVMDGRNDFPSSTKMGTDEVEEWRSGKRYRRNLENRAVTEAKVVAMEVCELLFDFRFGVRLQQFMHDFKVASEQSSSVLGALGKLTNIASSSKAFEHNDHYVGLVKRLTRSNISREQADEYLTMLFSRSNYIEMAFVAEGAQDVSNELMGNGAEPPLVSVLLDCAQYDYPDMVRMSVRLLDRFWSTHAELFQLAVQGQVLLEDTSVKVYREVEAVLPRFRRLKHAKLEPDEERWMLEVLVQWTDFCNLDKNNDESAPHTVNQQILYNAGVFEDILDVLSRPMDLSLAEYEGVREVFAQAFRMLKELCRLNKTVQARMFARLGVLLHIEGAENEKAAALEEVFTGNKDLCLTIPEENIQAIVHLVAKHQTAAPKLLELLMAIIKVEELNLALQRNQNFVVKYIIEKRDEILECAFIDDAADPEINRNRLNLMESGSDDQGNELPMPRPGVKWTQFQLDYHINLVDMLASCAEGENLFIESLCQTIFSIGELLEVFNDDKISVLHKRPYLRFFLWAYLNTEGSKIESGLVDIIHSPELWTFVSRLCTYLDQMTANINAFKPGDALRSDDRDFMFLGVMPFLSVFFNEYYDKDLMVQRVEVDPDAIGAKAVTISQQLVTTMEALVAAAEKGLDEPQQRQAINDVVLALANKCDVSEAVRLKLEQKLNMTAGVKIDSQVVQDYKRKYKAEIEMNRKLNEFAVHVQKSYEGLTNTVLEQLGHVPKGAEDRWYSELGGDEELPLGREFQNFVRTFADYKVVRGRLLLKEIKPVVSKLVESIRLSQQTRSPLWSAKDVQKQDDLDIKCFQVLRTIIWNENRQLPPDDADDVEGENIVWRSITFAQDTLNNHNAIVSSLPCFDSSNPEVVREALATIVALLDGGNRNVQAAFENYFLNTREETFFLAVSFRMKAALRHLAERRALLDQAKQQEERKMELLTTLMTQNSTIGADSKNANIAKQAAHAKDEIELQQLTGADDQEDLAQDLAFTDHGNIELVLRCLQLLCENYNDILKAYLREQPDNIKSINLVRETVEFLAGLYTDVHGDNIDLVVQCLETIVEYAQGNQRNQTEIFDAQVVDIINFLLRIHDFSGCELEKVAELKAATIGIVQAMLEDQNERTIAIAQALHDTLDVAAIHTNMNIWFFKGHREDEADWKQVGFTFFEVLARLKDFTGQDYNAPNYVKAAFEFTMLHIGKESNLSDAKKEDAKSIAEDYNRLVSRKPIFEQYADRTRSVEILRDGDVHRVRFQPRKPELLDDPTKQELLWNVDRSSPSDKVNDFLRRSKQIRAKMRYFERLQNNPVSGWFLEHYVLSKRSMLFFTAILNALILATWEANTDFDDPVPIRPSYYNSVLLVLGICHILATLSVVTTYFLLNPPENPFSTDFKKRVFGILGVVFEEIDESLRLETYSTSFFTANSVYHFLLLLMSALGIVTYGYTYAFHLFHIVVDNDILARAISSVTKNGTSLLYVAALTVVIIYLYSVVAFVFLRESFEEEEGLFCQTMFQCFLSSLNFGLRAGGGLGEVLPPATFGFTESGLRVLFDLSFFVIITIIALNVVFGIIVDTFQELRDEKASTEENMVGECFICSRKSSEFEQSGKGFDHHVKLEHNMWNYLYFMIHLQEKDSTDYTSHEAYVARLLAKNMNEFFPINRALSLQHTSDEVDLRLSSLEENMAYLVNKFKSEESERQALKEKERQSLWEREKTSSPVKKGF